MLDMYGQPHHTQSQSTQSSLTSQQYQYHQQHQQNVSNNHIKRLKLDHVSLSQQHQAVDLCSSLSSSSTHHQQQQSGSTDPTVSLYEVSSTTGCGSHGSGQSRGSHGVLGLGRIPTSTGYALAVSRPCLIKFAKIHNHISEQCKTGGRRCDR